MIVVVKYIFRLFWPKNKGFIEILFWNMRFMFIYILIRDLFRYLWKKYKYLLEMLYNYIINWLSDKLRKPIWNLYVFLFKSITIIYNILNFSYLIRFLKIIVQIQKDKKWYDSYYWILIDIFRYLFILFLDFLIYLLSYNYLDFFYKFFKLVFIDMAIGGFLAPVYWFIRFKIIDLMILTPWARIYWHIKLWDLIKYVQHKFRGFYYLGEFEKMRWWRFDENLEKSFREVLSGTDLDMDRERVTLFHYICHKYIYFYLEKIVVYIFYFLLFFYMVIFNYTLLLIIIGRFITLCLLKFVNKPLIKIRYLFKKYK